MKPLILLAATASPLLAQGPLYPPGLPEPTQKSLQEIWDEIGTLETQNAALQSTVAGLETQNQALTNLLLNISQATGGIPWEITTVDSAGDVGSFTSLAFTPGGQPAISYYDATNKVLKYAVLHGMTWALTTVDHAGKNTSLAFTPRRPARDQLPR